MRAVDVMIKKMSLFRSWLSCDYWCAGCKHLCDNCICCILHDVAWDCFWWRSDNDTV